MDLQFAWPGFEINNVHLMTIGLDFQSTILIIALDLQLKLDPMYSILKDP